METLLQDLRYAVRQLAKNPGFTLVAMLTLALGVGANTGVYTVANWALLRPTPGVHRERELATVFFSSGVSLPNYRTIVGQMPAFASSSGQDVTSFAAEIGRQPPRNVFAGVVSPNYFSVLGVPVSPGSSFTNDEVAAAGTAPVAVISHALWSGAFGSDPGIVGRTVRLNGVTVSIVGVTARGFEGTARPNVVELWVPYTALVALSRPGPFSPVRAIPNFEDPGVPVFQEIVGRLATGVTVVEAQTQLTRALGLAPEATRSVSRGAPLPSLRPGVGVGTFVRERVESTVKVLAAVSGVLLVLAMANLVNLLLFRAARRRDELAVRRALGATGPRLVRQGLVESSLLAIGGCAIALLIAVGLVELFRGISIRGLPADASMSVDGRVLGFGLLLSVAVGLIVGIVPPLVAGRFDLSAVLKRSSAKGSAGRAYVRSAMTVIQLAACLSLLVGAFLLIGTLRNLQSLDLGFDAAHVVALTADAGAVGYTPEQAPVLYRDALERIRRIPGVRGVAQAPQAPFGGGGAVGGAWTDALPADNPGLFVGSAYVSADYFGVLGIPVLRGRAFSESDMTAPAGAERVAVIGEKLASLLFPGRDPVGQTFMSGRRPAGTPSRVVGVVADSRWGSVVGRELGNATSMVYRPLAGDGSGPGRGLRAQILVRASEPTAELNRALEAAMAEVAPSMPVVIETMSNRVGRSLAEQRLFARVIGALTALAVVLASVGLFGLVGFSVAERRKEFGIRIALGAKAQDLLNLVVRQSAILAAVGIGVGLASAVALSRLIASRLFGVTPLEPYVYVGATAVLVLVVLVASLIPARLATRVDPMIALRSE